MFPTLIDSFVTQAKATAELESAAGEGDLASVQECLSRWAIIDNEVVRSTLTFDVMLKLSFDLRDTLRMSKLF